MGWMFKSSLPIRNALNRMDGIRERRCTSQRDNGVVLDEDNYYIPILNNEDSAMEDNSTSSEFLNDESGLDLTPTDEVTGPPPSTVHHSKHRDMEAFEKAAARRREERVMQENRTMSRPVYVYPNQDKVTCDDGTVLLRTVRALCSIVIPARSGVTVETNVVFGGVNEYTLVNGRNVNEIIDLDHHWLQEETLRLIQVKRGHVFVQSAGRFKIWVYNLSESAVNIATSSPLATLKTYKSQYPV